MDAQASYEHHIHLRQVMAAVWKSASVDLAMETVMAAVALVSGRSNGASMRNYSTALSRRRLRV